MSLHQQRVVYSNDGVLTDYSVELNHYVADTVTIAAFVAAEDYLFLGSPLPFNQKYFYLGSTVNATTSSVSVDIWNGSAWVAAVDVVDRTSVSGKSLAQSGYISFRPDIDASTWIKQQRSENVTGLTGTEIYNMYWARVSFSADLTTSLILSHIGHRFSSDVELYAQYPALNNATLKAAFLTSSTTWDNQAFIAAEAIINDLMERSIIMNSGQILDATKFKFASVHKTAETIFNSMGDEKYRAEAVEASKAYRRAMNMKNFYIDLNQNAELEDREKIISTLVLHR